MASKLREKKEAEGDALIKEADKALSTGFFKKADHDSAAPDLEKAGTCFKVAKSYAKAKDAYKRAGESWLVLEEGFKAAQLFEQAANMAKEDKDLKGSASLYETASFHYVENSKSDNGAAALMKAAKIMESEGEIDLATNHIMSSLDIYETLKPVYANQAFKDATVFLLRHNKLEETTTTLQRHLSVVAELESTDQFGKVLLGLVVSLLAQNDFVGAEKAYTNAVQDKGAGLLTGEAGKAATSLLDAFEKRDDMARNEVLDSNIFKYLDTPIAKLAVSLKVANAEPKVITATTTTTSTTTESTAGGSGSIEVATPETETTTTNMDDLSDLL